MQFHMLALFSGISSLISSNKRSLFPPPSLSRLREAPPTVFPRYGVSRFSLPNTRPLAANEKDPSASLGMTIRETCFPLFFYLALVIHPADRHFERSEKSFSSPFSHDSFVKPFTGSTVPAFPAIRCFPFFAIGHSPSYRQRKRSLDSARDDDTGRTRFQHILCMMHGVFILLTIISSVARNGNTGRTFSQRTLYTIQRISIPPHCHFERSEKSFSSPFSTTPSLSRLREAPPTAFPAKKIPRLRSG